MDSTTVDRTDPVEHSGVTQDEATAAPAAARLPAARDYAADRRLGIRVITFLLALCLSVAGYGAVNAARHVHTHTAPVARKAPPPKLPTPPPPQLTQVLPGTFTIPGVPKNTPWPSGGQASIEIEGVGSLGTSGNVDKPVSIASVAKTMTAYLILSDHPLTAGGSGPGITVSQSEAASYLTDLKAGQSLVKVVGGERISEREALEALMLASADNVAKILARWDAGSVSTFVSSMNRAAKRLGMTHTTYTDPSGLDPATVSTATDQIKLARAAMQSAGFRSIVNTRVADIPVQGTIVNFNRLLGQYGVIGIKTGSTDSAGGCLLFAATVPLGGQTETLIGAVLGQPLGDGDDFLSSTLNAASLLLETAEHDRTSTTVVAPGALVASVRRSDGGRETQLGVSSAVTVIGRPGQTYSLLVSGDPSAPTLVVASTGAASAGSTPSVSVSLVPLFARGSAAAE